MRKFFPFIVAVLLSASAFAGVRYTLRLETVDSSKRIDVVQNAWLQGAKAKFIFAEGFNPEQEIDADRYGAIAFNVDPTTHHQVKLLLTKPATPGATVKNIVTRKTLQEAGPVMLGHPTTHFRFSSDFDYEVDGDLRHGTITHELWVASDLKDFDLMNWLMFEYRLRQDSGIESLFRQVSTLGGGLPLAYEGIALVADGDGNTQVIRLRADVDSLETVNVDPSVFSASSNTFEVVAGGQ
ncbi:hypothetical protein Acid345_3534 [Candidatus Koribacter versatilis Ellin345]|uniref:Uncharacterized protein n=1 Tax=Koribacter versatilis (strain Ellin345) TaxID=204669 RepID=Q1IKR5_KORVE|nr:hypothetical protein [Candidatus Koribacter versatilis]ABF42535.1 hypothetical protein Acid345_3534 [Candidatus Koribacter versatilis Ellin345]